MRDQDILNLHEAYMQVCQNSVNHLNEGIAGEGPDNDFENWVYALVNEGYDLSEYTWNDMYEIYVEEVDQLNEGRRTSLSALARESQQRKADKERGRPETDTEKNRRLMLGPFRPSASPEERKAGQEQLAGEGRQRLRDRGKVPQKGGKDMFEHVLEHLVSEGYADTVDNALVIMSNMSTEWINSIVEAIPAPNSDPRVGGGGSIYSGATAKKPNIPNYPGMKQRAASGSLTDKFNLSRMSPDR